MNEATLQYVRQHADDDVRLLALRGSKDPQVDMVQALQQIQGRQTARKKLPSWAGLDALVYPPHLNMEQCSSEQTARYKAGICQRIVGTQPDTSLVDLTGGLGVDCCFMSDAFSRTTYVERNTELFDIASRNLRVLQKDVECVNADGTEFFRTLPHVSMFFLDPARRDDHGSRTYGISDCTPDVLGLKDELMSKADHVLLKLSPMLDWRKAVGDLGPQTVSEVHIVSVQNECKELLVLLEPGAPAACAADGGGDETRATAPITLCCVNDDQAFRLPSTAADCAALPYGRPEVGQLLMEPNASIMKAGCFGALSQRFRLAPLARDSHLFVPSAAPDGASGGEGGAFPGRVFRIGAVTTMGKRELRHALQGIDRANIATRNFPLKADELRRRLKLSDGGDTYIFGTTLADGSHVLIVCRKADERKYF